MLEERCVHCSALMIEEHLDNDGNVIATTTHSHWVGGEYEVTDSKDLGLSLPDVRFTGQGKGDEIIIRKKK